MRRLTAAQCATLVESIDEVIDSHTRLIHAMRVSDVADSKEFALLRAGARAALAHLEHILKIIGQAGDGNGESRQRANAALAEARAEIGATGEEEAAGDDEGRID